MDNFATAWAALDPAPRRALSLAYERLVAGGLPVGAVLVDAGGTIVAEGRNRAYDPPGGPDALQGTPLAHAELNVLAAVPTDRELDRDTLWNPAVARIALDLLPAPTGGSLEDLITPVWSRIAD